MPAVEVRTVPPEESDAPVDQVPDRGWYDPDSVEFAVAWDRGYAAQIRRPRVTRRRDVDFILPDED
jgi:hypothetical protein